MKLHPNMSRRAFAGLVTIAAFGLTGFTFDTENATKGLLAESRTAVTEDFFHHLRAGDYAGAQVRLATGVRKAETADVFAKSMQALGFNAVQSVLWTKRSSNSSASTSTGELEGMTTLLDGRRVPVVVKLAESKGDWRVVDVALGKATPQAAAASPASGPLAVPAGDDLLRLVQGTAAAYMEGLREKTLAPLHRSSSAQFQKTVSLENLNTSFKAILDSTKITGNPLQKRRPTISAPPIVDAKGEMLTECYYDFGKSRIVLKQTYIGQNGEWKLFGFNVRTVDIPAQVPGQSPGTDGVTKPIAPKIPVPVQK